MSVEGWLVVGLVAVLAELGVRLFDLSDSLAAPSNTLRALVEGLSSGELSSEIATTLEAYIGGLAIAIVVGVTLGVLIGASRVLLDASSVAIEFLRPIPAVALIPLSWLFFDIGVSSNRFVVAFAAVWPILFNTLYGVHGGDHMLHDVARTSGVGPLGRLTRVTLPSALPSIATGVRVSAAVALLVCVTAEFVRGSHGIGGYMQTQQLALELPEMYAAVVLTTLLGFAINVLLRAAERRAVFWAGEGGLVWR